MVVGTNGPRKEVNNIATPTQISIVLANGYTLPLHASSPSPVHATNCSYQTLVLLHFVACLKIQSAKCRANKQNQTKQMKIQVATCKANKTQQQQQRMRHILPAEEGGRRRRREGDGTKHGMAHSNPKQNFLFSHTRWPKSKKYSRQILLYEYLQAHEHTHTQGCAEGGRKGVSKVACKVGEIRENSHKNNSKNNNGNIIQTVRETDCDADTVSTRGVCVMRLQCKPKPKRKQKQKSQGLPCYKS